MSTCTKMRWKLYSMRNKYNISESIIFKCIFMDKKSDINIMLIFL